MQTVKPLSSPRSVSNSARPSTRARRQRRHLPWRWLIAFLFAVALLAPASLTHTASAAWPQMPASLASGPSVPIIVKFKATASAADIDSAIKGSGGQKARQFDKLRTHVLNVPAAARDAVIAALARHAAVERVNAAIKLSKAGDPNDPGYAQQWALPKIGWNQAYGSVAIGGTANLAVLDTGIDATHPDLAGRVVTTTSTIGGDPLADNSDPNGHGTALAGIAAANTNNGVGMAGVAWTGVNLMSAQVLQADGTGYDSDIIAGVLWAADNGANVILMGFSSPDYSPALADALAYAWGKGVVLVAATGNSGATAPTYPAGMTNVLGVAATDQNDNVGAGSNTGSANIAAPGVGIYATLRGGGYGSVSGTSAASGEVAGLAALLAANGKSNQYIFDQIRAATDPVNGAPFGRINVAKALGVQVTPVPTATGTPAPTPTPGATPVYVAATRTINSVTLNGGSNVTVAPGATIIVVVNVTTSSGNTNDNWRSTGWRTYTTTPGTFTCVDHADHNSAGTFSETFSITAPATAGTYNVDFIASQNSNCTGNTTSITLSNAIVVDNVAHLIVIKHVVNDNGGTSVAGAWTLSVSGSSPSPASFPGTESPGTAVTLNAGNYSVSESGPSGYSASFSAACAGTIALAETKTCTVTNDDIAPVLTLNKVVVNDNGGTAAESAWTLTANGGTAGTLSGPGAAGNADVVSGSTFKAGTYALSESGPSGYAASAWTCIGTGTQNGSNITLAVGQSATCTVTNDDIQPKLIVIKHVINDNGGTATAASFTMNVTGNSPSPASAPGAESPGTTVAINAGAYSVSETGPSGYSASLSADCTGSIAVGQTKTCTITNDDQAAHLIVIKHVINDNGGTKVAGDFATTISSVTTATPTAPGVESPGVDNTLTSVGAYSVDEGAHVGYDKTLSADCSGTIALGQTKTCTITNNDQPAHLIVIKHVINDNGGSKVAGDFTMNVTAGSPSPASFAGAESPGTNVTLNAGSYSVAETGPSGYSASFSADCTGTIANGQTKTCTVINDDIQPKLIVIKHVVNDNGGTAVAGDFTISVSGSSPSPASFAGAESPGTTVAINAGSYSVSETGPSGYSASSGADCSGSIAIGETKTCTITNDDIAPSLTLNKVVVNDNGGTAAESAWTLTANGGTAGTLSGPGAPGTADVVSPPTFKAGSYALSESVGPAGYSVSNWTCTGTGTQSGNSITLAVGQSATCTITNDDIQPKLTVIKHVVNDNGGTATASDFTMSVTGNSPSPASFPGAESPGTTVMLNAGSYSVGETGPSGYSASSGADCAGSIAVGQTKTCTITNDDQAAHLIVIKHVINDNGGTKVASDWTLDSGGANDTPDNFAGSEAGTNVTLDAGSYSVAETGPSGYTQTDSADCAGTIANGQTKTCTITNDDIAPTLTLVKTVINDNGGTKTVSAFPLLIDGNAATSGVAQTVNAGSHTASETTQAGYAASAWGGDCAANGTITLQPGDNKTCTITNDDIQPRLTVTKVVVNNNGGTKVIEDFPLFVGATTVNSGAQNGFNAGSYTVSETGQPGYAESISGDCATDGSITLVVGYVKSCTITNDDIAPTLTLVKQVVNDNGGTATASAFTLNAAGPTPISGPGGATGNGSFSAGTYALSESGPPGYAASAWSCVGGTQNGSNITLALAQTATCSITNDDIQPKLIVIKHVINDNGGTATASDFTMSVTGNSPSPASFPGAESPGTTVALNAGAYSVSETGPSGYSASFSADCTGSIAIGETKTCTITNDDIQPKLTVTKVVVNDNGGTKVIADFPLFVGATTVNSAVQYGFNAGSYTVSETGQAGYAESISGDCATDGSITLLVGDVKSCTVTNDDIAPSLTLVKVVVNDNGGTATASAFTLVAAGPTPISGPGGATSNGSFSAGTYALSESGPPGYAASAWSCVGGTQSGSSITLALAQTATCSITNDDIQPKLIVIKHVINDNGGTATAASFTMNVTGISPSPASFPGAESPGTTVMLNAGGYAVTESGPSGYTSSFSTDCTGSIAIGETKTCTITNDDQAAHLIVIKHVVNDNGGTKVASDWTLDSGGANDTPDNFAGSEAGTNVTLDAGSYNVTETGPTGYSASFSADCTGSIANGQTKTCTITNDDIQPKLTVIKVLVPNPNTGKFNLQIDGTTYAANVGDGGSTGAVGLNAGTHTVGETAVSPTSLANYALVIGGNCAANGSIILVVGDNKTCTITNTDNNGPLTSNVMASPNPVVVNTAVTISAVVDDSTTGGSNIASAEFNFDNGIYYPMSAQDGTFDEVSEGVKAMYTFNTPGVYTICVRGKDAAGNVGSPDCSLLIAVYDPNGGFVTGGGWIMSPSGACILSWCINDPTGRANFGFVSQYKKGATVPTGETEFQFQAGNLNFHSKDYQWLVVSGCKAQYKGSGSINGAGTYGFLLTAYDAQAGNGGSCDGSSVDRFRIKITDSSGTIVYDNRMGNSNDIDLANPQAISGGSIVIHK